MTKTILLLLVIIVIRMNSFAQWEQTSLSSGISVYCMTTKGNILFAGTDAGVYSSQNNGNTWNAFNTGLLNTTILSLTSKDSFLFAGTLGGGCYNSTDNGMHWSACNVGLTDTVIYSLWVYNNILFAGTNNGGIYSSITNGTLWNAQNTGILNTPVYAIINHGNNLFGATQHGIYQSIDSGTSWTLSNVTVTSFVCFGMNGNNLYGGSGGDGIFYSDDDFSTFNVQNNDMNNLDIRCITTRNNNIYNGSFGGGVYLSTDSSLTWITINDGLLNLNLLSLFSDSLYLYAGTASGGVWRRYLSEITGINKLINKKINSDEKIIEVRDISGRLIGNPDETSNNQNDLKQYARGIYFLTLQSGKGITHKKIIID